MNLPRLALGFAGAALLGCTDVDLYTAVDPDPSLPRVRVAALVCSPPEQLLQVPYKVLFVIDTSASNLINETDPPLFNGVVDTVRGVTRRETAVRNAISAHLAEPNVSFGIVTFSDFPQVQTFGFTRDPGALDAAVRNIGTATGWTNYSDTLIRVDEVIQSDLLRLDPGVARRTHYLVFWLSDGYPTRGITYDDPAVLSQALDRGVSYVLANATGKAAEVRFNTAYIGGGKPLYDTTDTAADQQLKLAQWTQEANHARQLLQNMATTGTGTFTDIPGGQAFTFPIDPAPMKRRFVIGPGVMVSNLNVVFGDERPVVDSDADGLADAEDPAPTNPDADGDGLRDGIEAQLPSSADPKDPARPGGCANPGVDADGDGLWDCEETLMGSSPTQLDTDGDQFLDSHEVLGKASPVHAGSADADSDGVTDEAEVRAHLNPHQPQTQEAIKRWSYVYQVDPRETRADGSNCYQVSVANVAMLETEPVSGRPVGVNTLELVVPFWPEDGGDPVTFYRARVQGIFRAPNFVEPATGTFVIDSACFEQVRAQ